ncbi:MAG: hypothetical protein LBL08_01265 [Candidatus Nomurabacteria bacterium]|jgi:hypothetical protein|nr:hypothetical protein [Candidatus Nomurabacteria bacterium]
MHETTPAVQIIPIINEKTIIKKGHLGVPSAMPAMPSTKIIHAIPQNARKGINSITARKIISCSDNLTRFKSSEFVNKIKKSKVFIFPSLAKKLLLTGVLAYLFYPTITPPNGNDLQARGDQYDRRQYAYRRHQRIISPQQAGNNGDQTAGQNANVYAQPYDTGSAHFCDLYFFIAASFDFIDITSYVAHCAHFSVYFHFRPNLRFHLSSSKSAKLQKTYKTRA